MNGRHISFEQGGEGEGCTFALLCCEPALYLCALTAVRQGRTRKRMVWRHVVPSDDLIVP